MNKQNSGINSADMATRGAGDESFIGVDGFRSWTSTYTVMNFNTFNQHFGCAEDRLVTNEKAFSSPWETVTESARSKITVKPTSNGSEESLVSKELTRRLQITTRYSQWQQEDAVSTSDEFWKEPPVPRYPAHSATTCDNESRGSVASEYDERAMDKSCSAKMCCDNKLQQTKPSAPLSREDHSVSSGERLTVPKSPEAELQAVQSEAFRQEKTPDVHRSDTLLEGSVCAKEFLPRWFESRSSMAAAGVWTPTWMPPQLMFSPRSVQPGGPAVQPAVREQSNIPITCDGEPHLVDESNMSASMGEQLRTHYYLICILRYMYIYSNS